MNTETTRAAILALLDESTKRAEDRSRAKQDVTMGWKEWGTICDEWDARAPVDLPARDAALRVAVEALEEAEHTFHRYADLHFAKSPPDCGKAEANLAEAHKILAAKDAILTILKAP